ncbi:hypothetical protein LTR56_028073, partial [Elasticomyces elasticus]
GEGMTHRQPRHSETPATCGFRKRLVQIEGHDTRSGVLAQLRNTSAAMSSAANINLRSTILAKPPLFRPVDVDDRSGTGFTSEYTLHLDTEGPQDLRSTGATSADLLVSPTVARAL